MPEQNAVVGEINIDAGGLTEPGYSFTFTPENRCVATDLFAEWSQSVSDEGIKAFLYEKDSRSGLPPVPNYRLYYGPKAGNTCPLLSLFDLKNPRVRFTDKIFDPIQTSMPLAFPNVTFEIVLKGTPVAISSGFGLRFSIRTRPFNS